MTESAPPPFWKRPKTYKILAAVTLFTALAGAGLGYFTRFDLPDVQSLEDYQPPEMTRVLARDGQLIARFAEEQRLALDHGEVPQQFQNALIAAEDSSFLTHPGVDIRGIARAALRDLRSRRMAQGASTLTMQLARNLFLHPEKKWKRKIQEALLALEIERQYSKEEILRFYANQVYMGHGKYGLEAAARHYFGKSASELNLTECATLVGLLPRPEDYSPLRNAQRAKERRNYVLTRMVVEGYLSEAEADILRSQPVEVSSARGLDEPAPYFTEEVRRWLQEIYGSTGLYKEGLEVETTMDPELQDIANRALDAGLRELDKRQGWRPESIRRIPEEISPEEWVSPDWKEIPSPGEVVDAVVVASDRQLATLRIDRWTGTLDRKQIEWTEVKALDKLVKPGDVVRARLVEFGEDDTTVKIELEQEPIVEAALVALDPQTGEVLAMVGGFNFGRSEFNRVTQAKRQPGSAFKPFVFAAALDRGWTLADVIVDEPTVFLDRRRPDPYQPENFTRKYYNSMTLRSALERSANIVTVKLLSEIGYDAVIDTARNLGIRQNLRPFPSLALGAFEATLLELTAAYGAFANNGVLVEPHWIRVVKNRQGYELHRTEPQIQDAVSPQVAFLINRVLSGVISDGTGRAAADLNRPLAGKTGTTDDSTDAWFVGYSPNLVVGVWVGFDEPRSLGSRETGAHAALPIWKAFMSEALPRYPETEFQQPSNISVVVVDRQTGKKANKNALCAETIPEVFIEGTEPTEFCTVDKRRQLLLPYAFQRYPLDPNGALLIPRNELDEILESELDVFLSQDGRVLRAFTEEGEVRMAVNVQPDATVPNRSRLREQFDVGGWRGTDGKPAEVVWLE